QIFCSWAPWERRVAQESDGERRACLSAWMREFAPAIGFRATQGTATASSSPRGLRVPFLLVTFLSGKQRKVTRQPLSGCRKLLLRSKKGGTPMPNKPFQFLDLPRQTPRELPVNVRVEGWNEVYGSFAAEEAAEQSARCLDCGNPYCEWKCPVHNYIPNWLALVREGRLFEAAD